MNKGLMINLGSMNQVALGHGFCFVVKDSEIAVFRTRDGKLYAIENKCPHLQGPLADGIIGEGKVVCPLHGHKFDLDSGKGYEEGECVKTFNVWEDHNNIMLEYA